MPEHEHLALTVAEAAVLLRRSKSTVRRMIKRGELPAVYIGRTPFIPRRAIERLFELPADRPG